jgi:hypothetical protein
MEDLNAYLGSGQSSVVGRNAEDVFYSVTKTILHTYKFYNLFYE